MKLLATIDAKEVPQLAGESLRNQFFDKEKKYEIFSWSKEVTYLENEPVRYWDKDKNIWEIDPIHVWDRAQLTFQDGTKVEGRYYWDGDGILVFIFHDGSCVVNTDCKKVNTWEYYGSFQSWEKGEVG